MHIKKNALTSLPNRCDGIKCARANERSTLHSRIDCSCLIPDQAAPPPLRRARSNTPLYYYCVNHIIRVVSSVCIACINMQTKHTHYKIKQIQMYINVYILGYVHTA